MEGIGMGKITIDFGVSRSKVKVKVTIFKNRIYCAKIWSVWEILIFFPISMEFFPLDSSQWMLSYIYQRIFCISYHAYRFQDNWGQRCGGEGQKIFF